MMGRFPGGVHGKLLQYFCLEYPHGQRSLVGYSPWGQKELDTTERISTAQTVAHQAPLSMGFSRQEYLSWLPFPSPGDLLHPGIKPASLASPALADRFFNTVPHYPMVNTDILLLLIWKLTSEDAKIFAQGHVFSK